MTIRSQMKQGHATCLDGGPVHCHISTGLDVVGDVLSNTRRCVWCGHEQSKPYGSGSRRAWRTRSTEAIARTEALT